MVCVCVRCRLSSGSHRLEVEVEANTSNYLYIGVISDSVTDFATAMNKAGMWTVQADGYVYDNGSGSSKGASAKLMTGARLVVVLDMDAKQVEFLVNGSSVATCSVSASRVTLGACFGGSGQKLKLVGASAGAASGASMLWDGSQLGPDCVVSAGGRGLTRTNSSGWGIQKGGAWYVCGG